MAIDLNAGLMKNKAFIKQFQDINGEFKMNITPEIFNHLVKTIQQNNLAAYIGAGFSKDCGLADWEGLITPLIKNIGLTPTKGADFIQYAQYVANQENGRKNINNAIKSSFSKGNLCNNQRSLAKLNISEVWTTNYDSMIEKGFDEVGKKYRVKSEETDLALKDEYGTIPIYKIHGNWKNPEHCILTQTDYEDYSKTRKNFINALKTSLLQKTFIFMGFSFKDPDIKYVLAEIRQSLPEGTMPEHYWIVKKDNKNSLEYAHNVKNLEINYKIKAIEIDNYEDIPKLLDELRYYANRKNIFISGAYLQNDSESTQKDAFISSLTAKLVESGMKIYSGYGLGVGSAVITGAMKVAYGKNDKENLSKYLDLHPFPQNIPDPIERKKNWRNYREDMCAEAGILIALYGCKWDNNKKEIINSPGCNEEFEIAHKNKSIIIPIASTNYMAKEIFEKVITEPTSYGYNTPSLNANLQKLNQLDPIVDSEKLINTVLSIVLESQEKN